MHRPKLAVLIALLGLSSATGNAGPAETLTLDTGRSKVTFTLGDVLHTVHGTFQLTRGVLQFDAATGKANGELIVDANSGDSGSGARDSKMKESILEATKYPEIEFRPDGFRGSLSPQGPSHIDVHGSFRIHGADHELTVPVDLERNNGQMTIKTHFDVPYVQWGMKNPSTFVLRVDKTVRIDVVGVGPVAASR